MSLFSYFWYGTVNCSRCENSTWKRKVIEIKECSHKLCKQCFTAHCMYSSKRYFEVRCPAKYCVYTLDESFIQEQLGGSYESYIKNLKEQKTKTGREMQAQKCAKVSPDRNHNTGKFEKNKKSTTSKPSTKSTPEDESFTFKRCSHIFSKQKMINHCMASSKKYVEVRCPAKHCLNTMDEYEIRELLGNCYCEYSFEIIRRTREKKSDGDHKNNDNSNREEQLEHFNRKETSNSGVNFNREL